MSNLFGPQSPYGGCAPASHASDPSTSHELSLVKRHPRSTYAELFDLALPEEKFELGDKAEVNRRLNTLLKAGLIRRAFENGELVKRPCRITGNSMTVAEVCG